MQPKLKSKVRTADRDLGEVTRVIVDPITHDVSHIVVGGNGVGTLERQIPMTEVQVVSDDLIQFRGTAADLGNFHHSSATTSSRPTKSRSPISKIISMCSAAKCWSRFLNWKRM